MAKKFSFPVNVSYKIESKKCAMKFWFDISRVRYGIT